MQKIVNLTLLLTLMLNAPALLAMKADSEDTLAQSAETAQIAQAASVLNTFYLVFFNESPESLLIAPHGEKAITVHTGESHNVTFTLHRDYAECIFTSSKGVNRFEALSSNNQKQILFTLKLLKKANIWLEDKPCPFSINGICVKIDKKGNATFADRTNVEVSCYQSDLLSEGSKDTHKADQMRELEKIKASLKKLEDIINP